MLSCTYLTLVTFGTLLERVMTPLQFIGIGKYIFSVWNNLLMVCGYVLYTIIFYAND